MAGHRHSCLRRFGAFRPTPTPLYQLMLVSWVVSGVLQLLFGPPPSVRDATSASWFDWSFVILQAGASITALAGMHMVELSRTHATRLAKALTTELVGLLELEVVIAWQIVSWGYYRGGPPVGGPSVMAIAFGGWVLYRMHDIVRALRELGRSR